ncbi:MAG TPA: hypothetical protein H9850_09005 [Candidatus Anaerobiospirillum pullistercoris]|uniref:Uncharacterized protein n=1 Tax=Candidatus Anaerobiospirillum pullistercoris TaxID=2838452 RepID=A0A9D1WEA0_9GAMM|nr:hypothetical protein [Candidatus Anaerobiospirillum pullistercoris]
MGLRRAADAAHGRWCDAVRKSVTLRIFGALGQENGAKSPKEVRWAVFPKL